MSGRSPHNLRALRDERGLTRQRVARDLDLSERTVIRHEDGTTPLRRAHLLLYADYYEVEIAALGLSFADPTATRAAEHIGGAA